MLVRLTCSRVCAVQGYQASGEIIDVTQEEAYRMIQSRQAEAVDRETAAVTAAESRTKRHRR